MILNIVMNIPICVANKISLNIHNHNKLTCKYFYSYDNGFRPYSRVIIRT